MAAVAPKHLSSGAHPTMTFPNAHLCGGGGGVAGGHNPVAAVGGMKWSPPEASAHRPLEQLQEAVKQEDWDRVFSEGKTQMWAQASWSASKDRCSALQCLASMSQASRVLEVGSFCGAAALALAEAVSKNGEVLALELEPFFVDFGQRYRSRSQAGSKIRTVVGPAMGSLKDLAGQAAGSKPFDMVVVDADKANMKDYFDLLWNTPGMLSSHAVVCLDTTPFKGQPPKRYVRFGQADRWVTSSGEEEIAALRAHIAASEEFTAHEFGGLLVVRRAAGGQRN